MVEVDWDGWDTRGGRGGEGNVGEVEGGEVRPVCGVKLEGAEGGGNYLWVSVSWLLRW